MRRALAEVGMSGPALEAAVARQMASRPPPPEIEIAADDEGRAVRLFSAMGTQWCWAPTAMAGGGMAMAGGEGVRVGLRYEAIPVVAGALGLTVDAVLLDDLQTIEIAALKTLAAQRR